MPYADALRKFYDCEGIAVDAFRCPHAHECAEAAHGRPLHRGAEAHVGSRYGEAVRIVIVSLDTGHEPTGLRRRRETIESLGRKGLNPHMRGTTDLVLQLLENQIPEASSPHPYYSMINAAKCSGADGRRNMVPARLYENCLPFALREIALLEPHFLVTQGKRAASVLGALGSIDGGDVEAAARALGTDGEATDWLISLALEYLRRVDLPNGDQLPVLRTPHPAARDGSWQRFKRISLRPVAAMLNVLVRPAS